MILASTALLVVLAAGPTDSGELTLRHRLSLGPTAKMNSKFVEQYGLDVSYGLELQDGLSLRLTGLYALSTRDSEFNHELIKKVRETAQAATRLHIRGGLLAGVELAPFRGEVSGMPLQAWLSAGVGSGDFGLTLVQPNETYVADAGWHLMGSVAVGARAQLTPWLFAELRFRDTFASAWVTTLNGCVVGDLDPTSVWYSSTCRRDAFPSEAFAASGSAYLKLLQTSSDILHLTDASVGLGIRL